MTNKDNFPEENGYNIQIYGRHVQITDAMKEYARNKLAKIERFHSHIIDIHLTMDIQKIQHHVAILVKLDHFIIRAEASTTDMYVSIDQAIDRLQKQIRRWKDKIQVHTAKKLSSVDMKVNIIQRPYNELDEFNEEIEEEAKHDLEKRLMPGHVVGSEKTMPMKELLQEEALMKIELSGEPFLLYRSEEDRKIKVIYRREDGDYGIIHAE